MVRVLFGLAVVAALALVAQSVPKSLSCFNCHNIADPKLCTTWQKCHHDEACSTETHTHNGHTTFTLACKQIQHCLIASPIGRRAQAKCTQCCSALGCNKDLCAAYGQTTTTAAPVTTTSATVTAASCRDKEEDGILCSSYDKYNFCTDTSSIAHELAVTKCPKHCGLCPTTTTAALTTVPATAAQTTAKDALRHGYNTHTRSSGELPLENGVQLPAREGRGKNTTFEVCEDREDAHFKCTDRLDLCIETSYFAQQLALDRCPKFCGLCGKATTTSSSGIA